MASPFTLEALTDRREPAYNFKWRCSKLPWDMDVTYVESVSLPFPTYDVADPLFGGATFFYYPGFVRLDSFSLMMYEDQDFSTTTWVTGWMYLIRNPVTGIYSLPKDYKREVHFELVNDKNEPTVVARLIGCWPSQVSNFDLNYTESGRLGLNITMSADAIVYDKA